MFFWDHEPISIVPSDTLHKHVDNLMGRDPRRTLKNEYTREGCFWNDEYAKTGSSSSIACTLGKDNRPTSDTCPCGTDMCLFDLSNDPCEEIDVSAQYPEITSMIYELLESFNDSVTLSMGELYPPDTEGADPSIHGGFWTPWMNADRTIRDTDEPISYEEGIATIDIARSLMDHVEKTNSIVITPIIAISFLLISLILIVIGNYVWMFIINKIDKKNKNINVNAKETQENSPLLANNTHVVQ